MKILFAVNKDIFSMIALNLVLPFVQQKGYSFSIMMTDSIGANSTSLLPELAYLEKDFSFESLFKLADMMGDGSFLTPAKIAERYGASFHIMNNVNTPGGHTLIEQHNMVMSIRYRSIFKSEAIAKARLGIVNLHSAPLPAYRGILGTLHALRNGETVLGGTLHFITDGTIDTGNIIALCQYSASEEASFFAHIRRVYEEAAPFICGTLEKIAEGKPVETYKQEGEGAYYSYPTQQQVDDFKKCNIPLVSKQDVLYLINNFL